MKIFISYAHEQRAIAELIAFTLQGRGYKTFIDHHSLPPGQEFDARIEAAIFESDILVFLVSPQSIMPGRYTLTELAIAKKKQPHPAQFVLPVMIVPTSFESLPAYLKAVSVLTPRGNISAETAVAVRNMAASLRTKTSNRGAVFASLAFATVFLSDHLLALLPGGVPSWAMTPKSWPIFYSSWSQSFLEPTWYTAIPFAAAMAGVTCSVRRPTFERVLVPFLFSILGAALAMWIYTYFFPIELETFNKGLPATAISTSKKFIDAIIAGAGAGASGALVTWLGVAFADQNAKSLNHAAIIVLAGLILGVLYAVMQLIASHAFGKIGGYAEDFMLLLWQVCIGFLIGRSLRPT